MKIVRSFLSNFLTFLLSLLLAILIWLNASQENDPTRLQSFQIPIDFIGQPENSTLVASDENMVFVVEAPSSVMNQLTPADFTAVVDLSQVALGEDVVVDVVGARVSSHASSASGRMTRASAAFASVDLAPKVIAATGTEKRLA